MPEGPTIRVTADRLREALAGERITRMQSRFKKAAAEQWREKIEGQLVCAVRAHGKNLFIDFASGWTLYTHMLMWGSWHIYARGEPWQKEERKARVVLETERHTLVLFSAPVCQLIPTAELAAHPTSELGPDLLAEGFGAPEQAEIQRRLQAQGARPIGEAIMDQTVMAGIGNILKSEILFQAGIHPLRPAAGLDVGEIERIVELSRLYMGRAYATNSFNEAFLPPALREATGKLGYVYRRSSQPCLRCGSTIQLVRQGQLERMTFFCPHCQPLDPRHPELPPQRGPQTPWSDSVRSLEDARKFVLSVGMCKVLQDSAGRLPTLWDAVAMPASQEDPAEPVLEQKIRLVWHLKNQLLERYPDEIFYGSIRGGHTVLMSMQRLRELYAAQHRPVDQLSPLAQQIYALVQQEPVPTNTLRQALGLTSRNERSRVERALQELQASFNIARAHRPQAERDVWVPFLAQYPQFSSDPA